MKNITEQNAQAEATLRAVRALSEHQSKRGARRDFRRVKVARPVPLPPLIILPH